MAAVLIAAIAGGIIAAGVTVAVLRVQSRATPSSLRLGDGAGVRDDSAVAAVAQRAQPAVVSILSDTGTGRGSGFLATGDGYVVTAVAAVTGAGNLSVLLSGSRRHDARVVDYDCQAGVAVLKVDQVTGLPTLGFGDSAALRVGQTVVAVGGTLGDRYPVSRGVVSGLRRNLMIENALAPPGQVQAVDVVQTDAVIDAAGTGGPLLTTGGQVVGMDLVAQVGGQVTGLAYSSNGIQPVVDQIVQTGSLTVAAIGARTLEVSPDEAAARGVPAGAVITALNPGGPAELALLRRGDTVVQVDDQRLDAGHPLVQLLRGRFKPNQRVTLTYSRSGATSQVQLTLSGEHPACA